MTTQPTNPMMTAMLETLQKLSEEKMQLVFAYAQMLSKQSEESTDADSESFMTEEEAKQLSTPTPPKTMQEIMAIRAEMDLSGLFDIDPAMDSVMWLKQQRAKRKAKTQW